jgi:hypothetical protein
MTAVYDITLNVVRYDPDSKRSWVQSYTLQAGRIMRFVDLFRLGILLRARPVWHLFHEDQRQAPAGL